MTTNQLNCASCGAPINVPENKEFFNCPYCAAILAVIRGEGYTALKMIETVTKTLPTLEDLTKKTGKLPSLAVPVEPEPAPEPLDEAHQLNEQIQLAEMQLANLQAEIVAFERNQQPLQSSKPLRRMYVQKFQLLENLRTLNQTLAEQGPQDFDSRIAALEAEIEWLNAELQALEQASAGETPEANSVWETTVDRMREYRRKLVIKIGDLQVAKIKSQLSSFLVKEVKLQDRAAIEALMTTIRADQDRVARMPQTLEVSLVKDELTARYQALVKAVAALKRTQAPAQTPLMIPVSSGDKEGNEKPESNGLFGLFKKRK